MSPSIRFTTLLLAAGALLLAACGDAAPEATSDLQVTATDGLEFEPDTFTVPAAAEITVELTSEPAVGHDLVIADAAEHGMAGEEGHGDHADDDHVMASGDLHVAHAEPGETVTAAFTIDEPGTYEVYCSVPGHREAGMVATLTVAEGG